MKKKRANPNKGIMFGIMAMAIVVLAEWCLAILPFECHTCLKAVALSAWSPQPTLKGAYGHCSTMEQ